MTEVQPILSILSTAPTNIRSIPKCSICKESGHNRAKCTRAPIQLVDVTTLTQTVSNLTIVDSTTDKLQLQPSTNTNTNTNIFSGLVNIICQEKEKEQTKDIWANSPFKDLVKLQSNNAGNVGEQLIHMICNKSSIDAIINGTKNKQKGGGGKDGVILGRSIEIKMAHQGCTGSSFQHELGEVPWLPQIIIFIDVAPQCIYVTVFPNFNEKIYKGGAKCGPLFPTKQITWRKQKGAFKLDTSIQINETNVSAGYAIKINASDEFGMAGAYIRRIVESVPILTEPVVALPEPVVALPEPVVALPEPVVALPEPVVALPEPAVALPEPAVALPEPAVALPEPAVASLEAPLTDS